MTLQDIERFRKDAEEKALSDLGTGLLSINKEGLLQLLDLTEEALVLRERKKKFNEATRSDFNGFEPFPSLADEALKNKEK